MIPDFLKSHKVVADTEVATWFEDKLSTDYCHNPDVHGTKLLNLKCFIVYIKNEKTTERVIIDYADSQEGVAIYSSRSLEGVGSRIDILKFMKRAGE